VSDTLDVGGGGCVDVPPGRGYPPSPLTLRARDGQTEHEHPDRTAADNVLTHKHLFLNIFLATASNPIYSGIVPHGISGESGSGNSPTA